MMGRRFSLEPTDQGTTSTPAGTEGPRACEKQCRSQHRARKIQSDQKRVAQGPFLMPSPSPVGKLSLMFNRVKKCF